MAEHKTGAAVAVKEDPIYNMLAKYKQAITSVLPKHLTAERMLRIAHTMIYKVPKLKDCSPLSLLNSVIEISILGLEVGRTAHIIPFKSEATVIVDYRGFIELAHRSNQIASFPFKPVYENDIFDYEEGTSRYIKHKPAVKDRGRLIAAYAIANFKNGGFDFEVVLPPDIEATKKKAPGARSKDSPWNDPELEWTMWTKTAVRRLAKRIPQCPELQKAAYLDEMVEAGLKQNISHVTDKIIDVDFQTVQKGTGESVNKEEVTKKLDQLKKDGQVREERLIHCPEMKQEVSLDICGTCREKCEEYKKLTA